MRTQNHQLMTKDESLLKHIFFWHKIPNVSSWLIIFIATMKFGMPKHFSLDTDPFEAAHYVLELS